MIRFAILFVCVVLCVPAFGQEFFASYDGCYIDPITKRQVCPLKKAAAVTGAVVSRAGAVIAPNDVALPVQPMQSYLMPAHPMQSCNCHPPTQQATVAQAVTYEQSGYKSWVVVPGRPLKNLISRAKAK